MLKGTASGLDRDAIYRHFPGYLGAGQETWRTTPAGGRRQEGGAEEGGACRRRLIGLARTPGCETMVGAWNARSNYQTRQLVTAMRRLRLQFRLRRMMVAVAVAGVILAFAKYVFVDNRPIDLLGAAIGALDGEYTIYADGYSELKFRSIRAGMTVRQVEEILGPPLAKGLWQAPNGSGPATAGKVPEDEIWHYALGGKRVQGRTASHWRRDVLFRNVVVWGTDRSYSID